MSTKAAAPVPAKAKRPAQALLSPHAKKRRIQEMFGSDDEGSDESAREDDASGEDDAGDDASEAPDDDGDAEEEDEVDDEAVPSTAVTTVAVTDTLVDVEGPDGVFSSWAEWDAYLTAFQKQTKQKFKTIGTRRTEKRIEELQARYSDGVSPAPSSNHVQVG